MPQFRRNFWLLTKKLHVVALLVERGNCSFEEKANVAMLAYPTVSFMVVYDDQPSKNLVSMRESYQADGIFLGMLFVSYNSGMSKLL